MADKISLTPEELQNLLAAAVEKGVKAGTAPNALEAKKLAEEIERERRRNLLAVELGRIEEEATWRRQNSCSHSRWPQSAGKRAGESAPGGQGEWCTNGQVTGPDEDIASLICVRCSTLWQWKINSAEERKAIEAGSLYGFPPPPVGKCLNADQFAKKPAHLVAR